MKIEGPALDGDALRAENEQARRRIDELEEALAAARAQASFSGVVVQYETFDDEFGDHHCVAVVRDGSQREHLVHRVFARGVMGLGATLTQAVEPLEAGPPGRVHEVMAALDDVAGERDAALAARDEALVALARVRASLRPVVVNGGEDPAATATELAALRAAVSDLRERALGRRTLAAGLCEARVDPVDGGHRSRGTLRDGDASYGFEIVDREPGTAAWFRTIEIWALP